MYDSVERPSLGAVLEALHTNGLVDAHAAARATACIRDADAATIPAAVRGLVGAGAGLAAVFFVACLTVADFIDFDVPLSLLIWGGVFLVCGVWARRLTGALFSAQCALAVGFIGKILLVCAAGSLDGGQNPLSRSTFAAVAVAAVTYPLTRDALDRALTCLGAIVLCIVWTIVEHAPTGLHVLMAAVVVPPVLGLAVPRWAPVLRPLIHASAAGVLGTACAQLVLRQLGADWAWRNLAQGIAGGAWPSTVLLVLMLFALYGLIARAAGGPFARSLPEVMVCTALLGIIAPPGLLAALVLLIAGRAADDRTLQVLGGLFLPIMLAAFYFALDVPLAWKSAVLAGSGAVLLSARWYLRAQRVAHRAPAPGAA